MEEKEIYVEIPKLGPKYKQGWIENNFLLEQASQVSGLCNTKSNL
mgnify:CR=1 FL=1